ATRRFYGRALVCTDIRSQPSPHQLGEDLSGIAKEPDRESFAFRTGLLHQGHRFVEILAGVIEISCLQPLLNAAWLALDCQHARPGHGGGQWLCSTHAAESAGQDPFPLEIAAIMASPNLGKGFVGALNDPLAPDVDPGACR